MTKKNNSEDLKIVHKHTNDTIQNKTSDVIDNFSELLEKIEKNLKKYSTEDNDKSKENNR